MDRDDLILFAESNTRFIVEIAPENQEIFEKTLGVIPNSVIGKVNDSDKLEVVGLKGQTVLSRPINELKEAWQKPLKW